MADPKITIKVEGSGLPGGGSDGQVLTRQGGKAVWGDAPNGFSGSWNDLTEKPFGETETWVEHIALTAFGSQSVSDGDYTCELTYFPGNAIPLTGTKIRVDFGYSRSDLTTYEFDIDDVGSDGELYTLGSADFSDTPFYITMSIFSISGYASSCYPKVADNAPYYLAIYYWGSVDKAINSDYLPKAAAVANAAGDTPTATEFNALLTALRNAGYLATE